MEGNPLAAVEGKMEERGLSTLPLDVKELIFSKLSFESIYGARSVCKEWNFILSSSNFLSSLPQQDPLLLFCGQQIDGNWFCVAYCFSTLKWMTRPLSFLPNFEGDNIRNVSNRSTGILLLLETHTSQLLVCNILTRTNTEIHFDLSENFVHIIQGTNKEPYLIAYSDSESFSFEIYHYYQGSWSFKCQYEEEREITMFEMVECNGVFVWMGRWPTTIAGYKIQDEGFITPVRVAPLPNELTDDLKLHVFTQVMSLDDFSMVSYGSSILMVGTFIEEPSAVLVINTFPGAIMFGEDPPNGRGIVIWELYEEEKDESDWNWREFVRNVFTVTPSKSSSRLVAAKVCLCGRLLVFQ